MNVTKQIKEFIELIQDPDVPEKEIISKSRAVKKSYSRHIKSLLLNGSLNKNNLDDLKKLIEINYKDLKLYPDFNEILEDIANQYLHIRDTSPSLDETSRPLTSAALNAHVLVLGNEGSHPENYSADYLTSVIRKKMDKNGINNPEILHILQSISKHLSTYQSEEFQKLANNTLILAIDSYFQTGKPDLVNPKIITALSELANSYKAIGDISMYEAICEKALKLKKFEHTIEYQNLIKDRNGINLQMAGFTEITLPTGKDLDENERFNQFFHQLSLIPAFQSIFTQTSEGPRNIENPGATKEHFILDKSIKIKNIFRILEALKKKYSEMGIDITTCYIGKNSFLPPDPENPNNKINSFNDYVIFPLTETDISILESFSMQKEGALYTAHTKDLPQIVSTTRIKARALPNVNFFPHTPNYKSDVIKDITQRIEDRNKKIELQAQVERKKALYDKQQEALKYLIQNYEMGPTIPHTHTSE